MQDALPFLIIPLFIAMWIGITLLLAHMGGWARLAKNYPDEPEAVGTNYRFQSASLGMVNYSACLKFRICEQGLRLSIMFPFRLGHPPLFIPWHQFHSLNEKRFLFYRTLETYIGMPVIACVILPLWMREHIEANTIKK